jgi:predicted ester cyclase
MSTETNKALIRKIVENVYSGDFDRIDELFAPSYVDHGHWKDREGLKHGLRELKKAYPGIRFVVEDLLGEGDRVAARIRCDCRTHSSDKGHERVIHLTTIFRLEDGRVVEHWGHSDSFL